MSARWVGLHGFGFPRPAATGAFDLPARDGAAAIITRKTFAGWRLSDGRLNFFRMPRETLKPRALVFQPALIALGELAKVAPRHLQLLPLAAIDLKRDVVIGAG